MLEIALFATLVHCAAPSPVPSPHLLWGEEGHRMVGRAAAEALPAEMPAFFRAAVAQLEYLNPEPDRWRSRAERELDRAMDAAHSPEHYVDFEALPANALASDDRYLYLARLDTAGVKVGGGGLLPYRILELTQRLRVGFRDWRAAKSPDEKAFIEARILNDAGILGHYVADGSNPHHTSIHHDRWVGENPKGYTTERGFHGRFEAEFVRTHITLPDVKARLNAPARAFPELRPAVWEYLRQSHSLLETLYELDKRERFGAATRSAEHEAFAAERLAVGARMLRDLWWTAWLTSAPALTPGG